MNARLRHTIYVWAVPVLAGGVAAIVGSYHLPESITDQAKRQSNIALAHFSPINVSLPTSAAVFPAGQGADIANANCLICHSADMVLRQPPLTAAEWNTEISKMKGSFGAPIPSDQITELAHYLGVINGRASNSGPETVDSQGN